MTLLARATTNRGKLPSGSAAMPAQYFPPPRPAVRSRLIRPTSGRCVTATMRRSGFLVLGYSHVDAMLRAMSDGRLISRRRYRGAAGVKID